MYIPWKRCQFTISRFLYQILFSECSTIKDEFHFQNDILPVPKVDKTKDNCSDYPEHECQPFREAFGKHIIVGNENHIYLDDFGKLQINPKENKCSNILEVSQ